MLGILMERRIEIAKILQSLAISNVTRTAYSVQTAAPPGSGKSALLQELVSIFLGGPGKR